MLGASLALQRAALADLTPMGVAAFRLLAGLTFFAPLLPRLRLRQLRDRRAILDVAVVGALSPGLSILCLTFALQFASSGLVALLSALAVRKVDVEQTEIRMQRGDDAPFQVEPFQFHSQPSLHCRRPQKSGHAAVALFRRAVPVGAVAQRRDARMILFTELVLRAFGLLQAKDVGALVREPIVEAFLDGRANAVDVPGDDLHERLAGKGSESRRRGQARKPTSAQEIKDGWRGAAGNGKA